MAARKRMQPIYRLSPASMVTGIKMPPRPPANSRQQPDAAAGSPTPWLQGREEQKKRRARARRFAAAGRACLPVDQ